jgi:hypothetical protein
MGKLSQGIRKALGRSAPKAICLVELAITADGLHWPAVPCQHWRRGQPSFSVSICRVAVLGGTQRQITVSQARIQGSDVFSKERNTQILVYLPVTYVPGGNSSNAKTLEL